MLRLAIAIAARDLRIMLSTSGSIVQAILLGLLLIFIFSLSFGPGEAATPNAAATIFWLGSVFCQILIFNQLYALEEFNSSRLGLLLLGAPAQSIWLGKSLAGFCLLFFAQLFFFPGLIVFLGQNFSGAFAAGIGSLIAVYAGLAASGALLGCIGQGQSGRDALLAVLIFPLLLPLLLSGIGLLGISLGSGDYRSIRDWAGIAIAFDAIFSGAGLCLFGFIYQGDE